MPTFGPSFLKKQAQASVSTASATVWAATEGESWTLETVAVGWTGGTIGGDITIREDSTAFLRVPMNATQGFASVYVNWTSSVTNSSLRINGPSGTVTGAFVGYAGSS